MIMDLPEPRRPTTPTIAPSEIVVGSNSLMEMLIDFTVLFFHQKKTCLFCFYSINGFEDFSRQRCRKS
ncbi:hypothetical protein ATCV1_z436L [Acanthocystis turfacea chlorella virus 1]|uniref:Uncharacterized protein z436L n=1 Tax=Chlorovirus heliozoae TaxID=322019 RepID=A7K946_9PHYC|nr:hypothetical protein ATCV1_z436L [Acanthocystis turfacea chlorella virus 1]ABT16570.1 hypothetical protein ATCV1_z436L [Acanthocystis turfacea chlorella virus 1]